MPYTPLYINLCRKSNLVSGGSHIPPTPPEEIIVEPNRYAVFILL